MIFTVLSNGLVSSSNQRSILKPKSSEHFTTRCGQLIPREDPSFDKATTILSTKAFSAVIADRSEMRTTSTTCELWLEQDLDSREAKEEGGVAVAAPPPSSSSPNVLVGFSPIPLRSSTTAPQQGGSGIVMNGEWSSTAEQTRLLSTPLLWEEPATVMLECSERGAFLWSDALGLYGKRIWDQCFVKHSESNKWVARVSMSLSDVASKDDGERPLTGPTTELVPSAMRYEFRVYDPSTATTQNNVTTRDGAEGNGGPHVWAMTDGVIAPEGGVLLSPVVTLIERGCSATIV